MKIDKILIEANKNLPLVKSRKELRVILAEKFGISPLTVEDYLVQRSFKTHFKPGKIIEFRLLEDLNKPEIAWFLGWVIGDGWFSDTFALRFELNEKDGIDLHEKFCKLFNKKFKLTKRIRNIRFKNHDYAFNSVAFNVSGIGFGLRSKEEVIKLIGQKKNKVPEYLFNAPEDVKYAFLKGIFESDGSISVINTHKGKKYLELIIYSPSFDFLKHLKQIFPFFGLIKKDKRSKKGFYRVEVRKQEMIGELYKKFYNNTNWFLTSKKEKFDKLLGGAVHL